ncbi:enolase-phosphatase E1-like [Ptychodera flava]|uniref:enolase-phosphatase E1-like n=1 Tax=Ptychodera flava TaxID=63121 RepID=UPI00396A8353
MSTQHFQDIEPGFCDSHPSDRLEFFCDTCQVPTCYKCTVVEHATTGHTIISLGLALEKYMPEMKAHSEKIAQKVSNLKLRKNRMNDIRKDLDANRSTADFKIKTLRSKLIDAIENQVKRLHSEVDDIYNQKCKQINAKVELLQDEIVSTESIHSDLNHLLAFGAALDILRALKQMKDEQEHHDDLTDVLCGDVDSDLGFTENPDCSKMNIGVVKGRNKPEEQVKLLNSNKADNSQTDIVATATTLNLKPGQFHTDYELDTSSSGLCPRGRENAFAERDVAMPTRRVVEERAKDSRAEVKRQTKPSEGGRDDDVHRRENDHFDDDRKDLDKSEESAEDKVTKTDDELANDNKVTIDQLEPKETDRINEPKEIVITRDATIGKENVSDTWGRQREVDEGQENGNEGKPLVVNDKNNDAVDVPDHNVSTETAMETERETNTTERDDSTITDDSKPEKHDDVENKVTNEQIFKQKEKSEAEKLSKVGEDHDDPEDTSPGRDMDKIGETQGKDDSMMPSDSQPEKPNDVESEIGGITTENSSAHIGDEDLQLKNAQNGENQDTSRSPAEDELGGSICSNDSNLEKQDDVENKARDEHAFEEKEKSDAEKLLKVGEDHDDPEDTSPSRDMDKIGETQGKDDSTMPSDSQREKPNDVEGGIEGITTDNSGAHIGEECLQVTSAQKREDRGTSRSRPEDDLPVGSKVDIDAESEQVDEGTDICFKADDREEQGDKRDKKDKSEQPYGNDTENVKYSSKATDETRGVGSENDKTYHRNKSYNEHIDPFGQQHCDNKHSCHQSTDVTATAPNIQHGNFYKQGQESDALSTSGTDSYDSTKDASSSGTNVWKRLWREAKVRDDNIGVIFSREL